MAQQTSPEEVVFRRLRRQLAHNRSPNCTEAKVGGYRILKLLALKMGDAGRPSGTSKRFGQLLAVEELTVKERHYGVARRRFCILMKPARRRSSRAEP